MFRQSKIHTMGLRTIRRYSEIEMETAWHESGHALALLMTGGTFKEIVLKEIKAPGGTISGALIEPQLEQRKKGLLEWARLEVMGLLAGHIAQEIYHGHPIVREFNEREGGDHFFLKQALSVFDDDIEAQLFLVWVKYKTEKMLRSPKGTRCLKAIAEALYNHPNKILTYAEVKAVMDSVK